jgi:hypothetical protein
VISSLPKEGIDHAVDSRLVKALQASGISKVVNFLHQ